MAAAVEFAAAALPLAVAAVALISRPPPLTKIVKSCYEVRECSTSEKAMTMPTSMQKVMVMAMATPLGSDTVGVIAVKIVPMQPGVLAFAIIALETEKYHGCLGFVS